MASDCERHCDFMEDEVRDIEELGTDNVTLRYPDGSETVGTLVMSSKDRAGLELHVDLDNEGTLIIVFSSGHDKDTE